jgi:hypothetical protein
VHIYILCVYIYIHSGFNVIRTHFHPWLFFHHKITLKLNSCGHTNGLSSQLDPSVELPSGYLLHSHGIDGPFKDGLPGFTYEKWVDFPWRTVKQPDGSASRVEFGVGAISHTYCDGH